MRFYAVACELGTVQGRGKVVADFANVACTESPGLASDHGGGHLASGENVGGAEFHFGAGSGVVVNGNERVGGVQADTDDVDFGGAGHFAGLNVKELEHDAKRNALGSQPAVSRLLLIRLFQQAPLGWGQPSAGGLERSAAPR